MSEPIIKLDSIEKHFGNVIALNGVSFDVRAGECHCLLGDNGARRSDAVVLLVEDEVPVRTFAARALRLRGLSVLEAANAEAALALLEDAALHVDVFVTDVVMPGLDGPGWVRQALERRPGVRTVFISGYAEESLSDDQARIPNSVFLPKPFSLTELTETVQAQLAA